MSRRLAAVVVAVAITMLAAGCNGAQLNQFRAAHGLAPLPATEADRAASAIDDALAKASRFQSFVAQAHDVGAAELGASWHPGCPVGPEQLVRLTLSHIGFDGVA